MTALPSSDSSGKATGYDLDEVEVVLFSPVQNSRRIILDAVHGAGFRRVNVVNTIDTLRRSMSARIGDNRAAETIPNLPASMCPTACAIRRPVTN